MKLRLSLTISGALSLGAYEGGVLAALLWAIAPLAQGDDPTVRLDAIGGASAGSITGLLAASCLAQGLDPIPVLKGAWVETDAITKMLHGCQDAPLSSDALARAAAPFFDAEKMKQTLPNPQVVDIQMVMMLACLRGFEYSIDINSDPVDSASAVTYLDLYPLTITTGMTVDDYVGTSKHPTPVEVALASGANAVGFPPRYVDRSANAQAYLDMGLEGLPSSEGFWYTDGGTIDNEPLGHTLDLVNVLDAAGDGFRRLHLLIHPHAPTMPAGDSWAKEKNAPTWLETLTRCATLLSAQNLYEDLRQVQNVNVRLEWLNAVLGAVEKALTGLSVSQQESLNDSLAAVLTTIEDDQRLKPGPYSAPEAPSPDAFGRLRQALEKAAGLSGKRSVGLDVISPEAIRDPKKPVNDLLAGDPLGNFGGFFDRRLRESDFDLGYQSALDWIQDGGLTRHKLAKQDSDCAYKSAAGAYKPRPELWEKWGRTSAFRILTRHPLALLELGGQITRVAVRDVVRGGRHRQ